MHPRALPIYIYIFAVKKPISKVAPMVKATSRPASNTTMNGHLVDFHGTPLETTWYFRKLDFLVVLTQFKAPQWLVQPTQPPRKKSQWNPNRSVPIRSLHLVVPKNRHLWKLQASLLPRVLPTWAVSYSTSCCLTKIFFFQKPDCACRLWMTWRARESWWETNSDQLLRWAKGTSVSASSCRMVRNCASLLTSCRPTPSRSLCRLTRWVLFHAVKNDRFNCFRLSPLLAPNRTSTNSCNTARRLAFRR